MATFTLYTYDVWGNPKDGYQVNDVYKNSSFDFQSEFPDDKEIKKVLDIKCRFETTGDDEVIYINRSRDNYPMGELRKVL